MKSQKGIIHLGLILILLIFGIGALGYVMYKTNSLPVVTTSSPTPEAMIETSDSSQKYYNDTDNWKNYYNKALGFSVNYPPNSILIENFETPDKSITITYCKNLSFEACTETSFAGQHTSISFSDFDKEFSVPECISDTKQKLTKNNIIWSRYFGEITEQNCPDEIHWDYYLQQAYAKKDKQYVELIGNFRDKNEATLFDQIRSTFEFVDKPGDSESWNTYTNTKYKYTFEYPKSWKVDDELTKDGATNTSESVLIYSPETNGTGTLFNGITIQNSGMLVDTTNRYRVTLPNVATTVYKQDTMHGEVYYINIPDTDQFLSLTGAGGYTDNEDINQTVKKIFSTFKLPY